MIRVRTASDGTFWISRSDKDTEDYLDSIYNRLPNQLKWRNIKIEMSSFVFKNLYVEQAAYIVGKGPSLDNISEKCFRDPRAPIICINESIHIIEKLDLLNDIFVTQLDHELEETCRPIKPTTKMFTGPMCANLYKEGVYRYVVDPAMFGLIDCISAEYAIMLARHMGCISIELFCFDSCLNKSLDYAKCIGYDSAKGGPKDRFLSHKDRIIQIANKVPLVWNLPRADKTMSITEGI